jgi:hypothetical protein
MGDLRGGRDDLAPPPVLFMAGRPGGVPAPAGDAEGVIAVTAGGGGGGGGGIAYCGGG